MLDIKLYIRLKRKHNIASMEKIRNGTGNHTIILPIKCKRLIKKELTAGDGWVGFN